MQTAGSKKTEAFKMQGVFAGIGWIVSGRERCRCLLIVCRSRTALLGQIPKRQVRFLYLFRFVVNQRRSVENFYTFYFLRPLS
jgi:hypothetical protein